MWKKGKTNKFYTYYLEDEPELLHFIRTGFKEGSNLAWLVVYEDAYEVALGTCKVMSTAEILREFKIDLNEDIQERTSLEKFGQKIGILPKDKKATRIHKT